MKISKILIANRGEIAIRVMRIIEDQDALIEQAQAGRREAENAFGLKASPQRR